MDSPRASRPLKLLVVEDSESDYDLLLRHLKRNGFAPDARRVQSASELAAALADRPWDFVVTDYNVPGFGAMPALRQLAESGLDIPVVIMSGAIGEEAAVEAMRAGAEDFISKDRPARLVPAIQRGLEAAAARRERRDAQDALTTVAANLPVMIFRLRREPDGRMAFEYASAGSARLFGFTAERLLADPHAFLAAFEGRDRERFVATVEAAAARRQPLKGEYRVQSPAGSTWVQLRATPHAGALPAWDGLFIDVTPMKAAEERLIASQSQLRELTAHLERAKESERASIAREIHDDIGGSLTAMKADLASLAPRVSDPAGHERLDSLGKLVDYCMQASRRISQALRPSVIDHGLFQALRSHARDFAARHGVPVQVTTNDEDVQIDLDAATALFRIFQEALTNIAKHAAAKRVEAHLFANPEMLTLEVRDDGRGLDPASLDKTGSFGVFGMHQRVLNLGGWMEIDGAPGRGTTLMVSLPRAGAAAATEPEEA